MCVGLTAAAALTRLQHRTCSHNSRMLLACHTKCSALGQGVTEGRDPGGKQPAQATGPTSYAVLVTHAALSILCYCKGATWVISSHPVRCTEMPHLPDEQGAAQVGSSQPGLKQLLLQPVTDIFTDCSAVLSMVVETVLWCNGCFIRRLVTGSHPAEVTNPTVHFTLITLQYTSRMWSLADVSRTAGTTCPSLR